MAHKAMSGIFELEKKDTDAIKPFILDAVAKKIDGMVNMGVNPGNKIKITVDLIIRGLGCTDVDIVFDEG